MKSKSCDLREIIRSFSLETKGPTNVAAGFSAYLSFAPDYSLHEVAARISEVFTDLRFEKTERFDEFPAVEAVLQDYSIALLGPSEEQRARCEDPGVQLMFLALGSSHEPVDVSESLSRQIEASVKLKCEPLR